MRLLVPALFLVVLPALVCADDKKGKPLTTAEAAKKVNQKCTVVMDVKSTGRTRRGARLFLNSEANYKSDKNFVVVIDKQDVPKFKKAGIADPLAHFKGKAVRVTGTVILYNGKPQIKVDDPGQIKVVDKKGK